MPSYQKAQMNTYPFLNWHYLHLLLRLQKMFLEQKTPSLSHHTSLYIMHFLKHKFYYEERRTKIFLSDSEFTLWRWGKKITMDQLFPMSAIYGKEHKSEELHKGLPIQLWMPFNAHGTESKDWENYFKKKILPFQVLLTKYSYLNKNWTRTIITTVMLMLKGETLHVPLLDKEL